MAHKLDNLANHVIVIGFGALGYLVAGRLHDAESKCHTIEATTWRPRPPISVIS
jgi:hypothetical protein